MDLITTPFERVVHLGLYVLGLIGLGVCALAVLERVGERRGARTVRMRHVAAALGAFVMVAIVERVYHLLH